ncbi:hypothetical protein ACFV98_35970 [Streptomyces violascens]|uniref:hypothetical protein n=1 Tax=Streptomyces violascens TaxID=67381 RepID=UPI00365ECA7D
MYVCWTTDSDEFDKVPTVITGKRSRPPARAGAATGDLPQGEGEVGQGSEREHARQGPAVALDHVEVLLVVSEGAVGLVAALHEQGE